MKRNVNKIISFILSLIIIIINIPIYKVYAEGDSISIVVKDAKGEYVSDANIYIEGVLKTAIYNENKYSINVSDITEMNGVTVVVKSQDESVSSQITFVSNVYEYEMTLKKEWSVTNQGGEWNGECYVVSTEYNADRIRKDSLIIRVFRDGSPIENPIFSSDIDEENRETGELGWYQHTYVISKENFKLDGVYSITVSTEDEAGNYSENISYSSREIRFAVDTTKPQLVKVTGLNKNLYNANKIDVTYEVFDAVSLKKVNVYVDNKLVQSIEKFENVVKYEGLFTIEEGMNQSIRFEVEDMAGNITDSDNEEDYNSGNVISFSKTVTVSENFFVRWYANKIAFCLILGIVVVLLGGIIVLFVKKKDKDYLLRSRV